MKVFIYLNTDGGTFYYHFPELPQQLHTQGGPKK